MRPLNRMNDYFPWAVASELTVLEVPSSGMDQEWQNDHESCMRDGHNEMCCPFNFCMRSRGRTDNVLDIHVPVHFVVLPRFVNFSCDGTAWCPLPRELMNNVQSLVKTHAQQEGINKLGMHLEVSAQLQIDKFVGGALFFYVAHGHDLVCFDLSRSRCRCALHLAACIVIRCSRQCSADHRSGPNRCCSGYACPQPVQIHWCNFSNTLA